MCLHVSNDVSYYPIQLCFHVHVIFMICHVMIYMSCGGVSCPICTIHRFYLSMTRSSVNSLLPSMHNTSTLYPSISCHPLVSSRDVHPILTCDFVLHLEPSFSHSQPMITATCHILMPSLHACNSPSESYTQRARSCQTDAK